MLDFNCRILFCTILLWLITSCNSEPISCESELCVIEGKIAQSKLMGIDSSATLAVSKAVLKSGEVLTLLGDCAFGNEPGTYIKVEFGTKPPQSIRNIIETELLPDSIVPIRVLERRVFSDFTPAQGTVFSSSASCFT